MTVIRFPQTPGNGTRGPRPIYVRAPGHEDLPNATRKICLGYTRDDAQMRFCKGGLNLDIAAKTSTLPKWLKVQLMSQFDVFIGTGQSLSEVEEDARTRLGSDPCLYGRGFAGRRGGGGPMNGGCLGCHEIARRQPAPREARGL